MIQTGKGQELWLNAPRADATFRYRLRKALPGTAPEPNEAEGETVKDPMEARS